MAHLIQSHRLSPVDHSASRLQNSSDLRSSSLISLPAVVRKLEDPLLCASKFLIGLVGEKERSNLMLETPEKDGYKTISLQLQRRTSVCKYIRIVKRGNRIPVGEIARVNPSNVGLRLVDFLPPSPVDPARISKRRRLFDLQLWVARAVRETRQHDSTFDRNSFQLLILLIECNTVVLTMMGIHHRDKFSTACHKTLSHSLVLVIFKEER
ncbi:uncharacterized protein PADG_04601 [Paracoccidioides brasiliensis Pb18]|uniref:Uncharacterized protein n=1 Tax=Paracoccidioides brasiliensis (strain Pb18) TaxID=502780 RepID=C1GC79_PARBD|nr:uncharacterized protein PADG_04601 [Paracoccidioides brasiliensis Pb18]EEH48522.2 hypothetical protein PADG_04601 [Paracoccidioides brasiliensis Pb18]